MVRHPMLHNNLDHHLVGLKREDILSNVVEQNSIWQIPERVSNQDPRKTLDRARVGNVTEFRSGTEALKALNFSAYALVHFQLWIGQGFFLEDFRQLTSTTTKSFSKLI